MVSRAGGGRYLWARTPTIQGCGRGGGGDAAAAAGIRQDAT